MTDQEDQTTLDSILLRHVQIASAELRRGDIVSVHSGDAVYAVLASETASEGALERLRQLSESEPFVALTARRAAVLHVLPTGADVMRITADKLMDAAWVRSLADPTKDLSDPLRGPLASDKAPVHAAVEAAIRLSKLAQLLPSVCAARIADPASIPDGVARVEVDEIERFDEVAARAMRPVSSARVPLAGAEEARLIGFRAIDGGVEHYAIVVGEPDADAPVLTRIHSECFTGDLLGSLKCDCGQQLRGAIEEIGAAGTGVLLYLAQEGRGIGLMNKLRAYELQDTGFDTVEANERLGFEPDERVFAPAAHMLRQLGFRSIRLMTNNPEKVGALADYGIEVTERVAHQFPSNAHNELYLATKAKRSGHYLSGYSGNQKKAGGDH